MKTNYIKLSISILIIAFFFSCSQRLPESRPVPININGDKNFGNIQVNTSSINHQFFIQCGSYSGASYNFYYEDIKIKITLSDNVNFTLNTSNTDLTLGEDDSTTFQVKFNPKSAGIFKSVIKVEKIDLNWDMLIEITGNGIE